MICAERSIFGVTGHTVTGLQEGRAYRFRVVPVGVGADGESATLDAHTPLRGPTQVTATKTAPWQATLAWQPSPSPLVTGYDVWCSVNGDLWRFFDEVDAATTGYRFASATAGNIAFAVRARGDGWWDGLGDGSTGGGNTGGGTGGGGGASSNGGAASDTHPATDPATGGLARPPLESAAGDRTVYDSGMFGYDVFDDPYLRDPKDGMGWSYNFSPEPDNDLPDGWFFPWGQAVSLTVNNLPPHRSLTAAVLWHEWWPWDIYHPWWLGEGKLEVGGQSVEGNGYVTKTVAHTDGSVTLTATPRANDPDKWPVSVSSLSVTTHTPHVTIRPVGSVAGEDDEINTNDWNKFGFWVSRSGPAVGDLEVQLRPKPQTSIPDKPATSPSLRFTARPQEDYTIPTSVTIPDGEAGVFVPVTIIDDTHAEPRERLGVQVLPSEHYVTGDALAVLYIEGCNVLPTGPDPSWPDNPPTDAPGSIYFRNL